MSLSLYRRRSGNEVLSLQTHRRLLLRLHQTGHRADVCPHPPDVPTCKDCEAQLSAERRECKPKCSLEQGLLERFLPPVNRRKEQTPIGRRRSRTLSYQRGDPSSRSSTIPTFAPGQETLQFEVPVPLQDPRKDAEHPGTNKNLAIYAGKATSASSLLYGTPRRHKLSCTKGSCQRYELALLAFAAVQHKVERSISPVRRHLSISPLPRNMHPVHHAGRREARTQAIYKRYGHEPTTAYTNAASYPGIRAMTAVVVQQNHHVSSITLPRYEPLQAEEAAIALAIAQTTAEVIITDSQHALITIIWTPAHSAVPGDATAYLLARELSRRALGDEQERPEDATKTPPNCLIPSSLHTSFGRALTSSNLDDQLMLVSRAVEAGNAQGV
ncbi:hypothetical protein HPB47_027392 [Ixodes persulcatus]|uniref:Uncharacterized protein n=1 Tax=Ixodes persulcatus TaxID=34615 RepID=A0AC60PXR6_IXOPE|nr:hypothetical protein HPB47_027392 [Ixodes persulcatus]